MEVAPSAHKVNGHAASLLAHLNLQREQAQFCDCVLRQGQNPGQLYPAHRCVLAASSPVLASILSSTGALVELQAPCLSDSVLALLLDYVYTGDLPFTYSQQQHFSLLTAACYLQMDELQQALSAWQQTWLDTADNADASTVMNSQQYKHTNEGTVCDLPSASGGTFRGHIMPGTAGVLDSEDQHSANVEIFDKGQLHLVSQESRNKEVETGTRSSKDGANHCSRTNASTLSTCHNGFDDCRQATSLTPHSFSQHIRCTNEVCDVCGTDKKVQKDLFYAAGTVKPEVQQISIDEKLVRTPELRTSSSPPSSHPCCGAVPVICHSSRAAISQLAEVCGALPYHPAPKAPLPLLTGTDDVEGIPKKHEDQYGAQNEDCTQHVRHDSIPQKNMCNKGLQNGADYDFEDFPTKHKRIDCFESLATNREEQDESATVPVEDSNTGSDSHCEDFCPDGEMETENGYGYPADMDIQDSHHTPYEAKPNTCGADISTSDANSNQHAYHRQNMHVAMENKERSANLCQPVSNTSPGSPFECHISLQPERNPGTEIAFTTFVDSNIQHETTCGAVVHSYHGHLHYHCLQETDMHLLHGGSDHQHSQPSPSDPSDVSSNEDEVGTFGSLDQQHCATETTEQVLLLDISTKPAELLVTCKHTSDTDEVRKKDTFKTDTRKQDRARREVEMKITTPRAKLEVGNFDETEIQSWDKHAQVEERKLAGTAPKMPGANVIQRAPAEGAVSTLKEGENQISTWTVFSQPGMPDSVQASVSSSLSVCIPSTLSASMPTNVSAHLSPPVHHPFQCSLCDRSFSQRGSLNRHVRSHLGVRPFPCPRCPMTFSRQYRVTEHMRVHQRCALGNNFHNCPDSAV
ncbi:uncharacterized protein LOC114433971 [Parambassis ranga]|uniref:Uncharacterized protein LOC114433971 n=1 Tax=Parambassis ranga TaxID=210632 RepID=A0A6P7I211_9TELE|nr:uncharacterized protein LOC114433971 [Parambassis ranga]